MDGMFPTLAGCSVGQRVQDLEVFVFDEPGVWIIILKEVHDQINCGGSPGS